MGRVPRSKGYFELFDGLASQACRAAKVFCSNATPEEKAERLRDIEHEADEAVHAVTDKLNEHQEPPLRDLDDIQRLVYNMDNVIDCLEEAANRILIFRLTYIPEFMAFGSLALNAAEQIKAGLPLLKKPGKNSEAIKSVYIRINEIESEADGHHRATLEKLMSTDPETLDEMWHRLKIKEVLQKLEDALDQCEDVGELIEALKKKNA